VALTLSPIRDDRGQLLGFSSIERDIGVLKQLEREREEWASVVAHDLRQPAAAIRLVTDMLARAEGDPAKQTAIERIRRAGDRLERMIADLLDVSRIEAKHLALKTKAVNLGPLVAEVIDNLPEVKGRCLTRIPSNDACAWVDTDRFVQVLSNLLSNACKYGDPGTPIDVRVEPDGEMVRVTVSNEGPGIAADEIPKIFSRFVRTRAAQSSATPGLGLGLYICRGLVEAHGGALWVESVPGKQTHFRFTLPRAPMSVDERRPSPPPSPAVHAP
jgi:signal transduction histidine kinase